MKCNSQGRIAFGYVYTTGAVYCIGEKICDSKLF